MQNDYFFSVIVPVYKVEKYLRQCVDSVLGQSFTRFELILVDDGSPDSCPAICEEYARTDERVRVIHKTNGGLSSARNAGLRIAAGQYICFLDSDDYWLDESALERLYKVILDRPTDVVLIRSVTAYEKAGILDKSVRQLPPELRDEKSTDELLAILVAGQFYCSCAWDKVISRELTNKNDLLFTEGILGEDVDWTARLAMAMESIAVLPEPIYVYRKGRPGSLTDGLTEKNLHDTKDSMERCLHYIENTEKSAVFRRAYYNFLAFRYVIWMAENGALVGLKKTQLAEEMKHYDWLLKYDDNRKVHLASLIRQMVGWEMTAFLLGRYLRRKKA